MSADVVWMLLALALAGVFGYVLYRLHADASVDFDLTDILKRNGHVSRQALIELGAFMATTFVLIHQELTGVLTDTYVAAYGTFWILKGVTQILKGATTQSKPEDKT